MNWIEQLLQRIDYSTYYPKGKSTGPNQISVHCPFHQDKHASLSINVMTGLYYCHACNEKGNFLTWAKHQNLDLRQVAQQYQIATNEKTIDKKTIDEAHQALLDNPKSLKWWKEVRGISLETLRRFKIGLYNKKFSIPIYDIVGELVNIRLYDPLAKDSAKVLSWKAGFGGARLFAIENLYNETVMITEGETDCLIANQYGYNAVTGTAGATSFSKEWAKYFTGKKVIICYDVDDAGRTGAARVAKILSETAAAIKIVNLPLDPAIYPKGDLTDYFVKAGHSKSDLNNVLKQTELYEIERREPEETTYEKVTLDKADHSQYNQKYIETTALISGKDLETFIVPKKLHITCTMSKSDKVCPTCPISFDNGDSTIEIQPTNELLLGLCNVTNLEKKRALKEIADIPNKCELCNIDEMDSYNIEDIILTTDIEYTTSIDKEQQFVTRTSHFIGHNIETNRAYDFKAKTVAHPKTQKATHLIFEATPSITAIDSYKFNDKIGKKLIKFQCDNIKEKMAEIYETTIQHVSGLKGREDLFTLALLTFASPLGFNFENKFLNKGYVESLVIGDTRTGKTEMMKCLIEYFRLGELVLGESASFAGLVGGLQQIGSRWHLTWGRIPLNNKRLVAIDEMSGLSTYEIAKLSGIRSSGIAEITKIRTERTWARTRLIWMSNPRGTREETKKMMSSYSQGVRSIPELIGKAEDISRFDLILCLGIDDVPIDLINRPTDLPKKLKYSGDDFHNLIMFAWTLSADDIIFTKGALDAIYKSSKKISEKYDETIPLVVPSSQRIKIAKIAVATATMVFNYIDNKLVVEESHVNFATEFLEEIFDKPICAYDEYSRLEKARHKILNEDDIIKLIKKNLSVVDQLLDIDRFNQGDLQEIFDTDSRVDTRKIINTLVQGKAIKRSSSGGYEKTSAFIRFLRESKNGKLEIEEPEDDTVPAEIDGENIIEIEDEEFPF